MYSIIEQTPDFLVVEKPQGIGIHCEENQPGFIAQLKQYYQLAELYPVHRLDKVTSGLLICALHQKAASELSQLFQYRKIEKYYLAISDKKPKKKQGAIIGDMERSRRSSWMLCKTRNNPAVTQFFSYSLGQGQRLFLLKPCTGKTHQLRVALKSLGAPIVGDRLYGANSSMEEGILLHACALSFTHNNKHYSYISLPQHWPESFQHWCQSDISHQDNVTKPWDMPWPTQNINVKGQDLKN